MSLIVEYGNVLLALACIFGFFMAWGVGANDVSNAMGTSVGARALTIRQAILIAMGFEFAGAYLAGGGVTETIRSGIVDTASMAPDTLVFGMLSSLLAAGIWLALASVKGWPVSTTHTLVGGIIGFTCAQVSASAVKWHAILPIIGSWVVTPVIAAVLSFSIFTSVQLLILNKSDPLHSACRYVPFYMFFVGTILALMTLTKGLKHVGLSFTEGQSLLISLIVGALIMGLGKLMIHRIHIDPEASLHSQFANVEKVFAILMVFTACSMAFAHGSNDVSNAVGPVAAIVSVVHAKGDMALIDNAPLPSWVLLLGALGIVFGLATYGYRVIATIGKKITELTPSRGFAAEMSTATLVVGASAIGLPVSTTHTLVGAVLGIGLARGIGALNLNVIGRIFISWVVTLPAGAILSILFFYIIRLALGH